MTTKHWTVMVPITIEAEDEKAAIETAYRLAHDGASYGPTDYVGMPKEAKRVTEFTEDFVDAYDGAQLHASLNIDMNGDGEVTGCWISTNYGGSTLSASLAALQDTSMLEHESGANYVVAAETIQEIADWAEEYGY